MATLTMVLSFFLLLFSPIHLIGGLINPKIAFLLLREKATRPEAVLLSLGLFVLSLSVGITSAEIVKEQKQIEQEQKKLEADKQVKEYWQEKAEEEKQEAIEKAKQEAIDKQKQLTSHNVDKADIFIKEIRDLSKSYPSIDPMYPDWKQAPAYFYVSILGLEGFTLASGRDSYINMSVEQKIDKVCEENNNQIYAYKKFGDYSQVAINYIEDVKKLCDEYVK